jgi:hypothetical protein
MLIGCILRRKNNFRFKIHRRAAQRNGFFMAPHYIYGTSGLGVRRHKEPCTLCKLGAAVLAHFSKSMVFYLRIEGFNRDLRRSYNAAKPPL